MRENAGVCDRETAYESEGWHEIKRERERESEKQIQ